ncbi:hypothetical protein [Amnibacterium kyonggiense]
MAVQTLPAQRTSTTGAARRPDPRAASSWWAPLAAACLVACVAHLPVTAEHLHEAPYIGVLFIALEVASVVLAAALVIRPTALVHGLVCALGAAALVGLVVSRTVGLPMMSDDIGNWAEPLAVVSVAAETVMTVGGALAVRAVRADRTTGRRIAPAIVVGALVLVAGLLATWLAADAEAAPAAGTGAPGTSMDMPGMTMDMPGMQGTVPTGAAGH